MEMPDEILLSYLNLRCAFYDRKSEEKGTDRMKAKYKLLTQKDLALTELGVFIFHILTTTEDSYPKEMTMDIYPTDWEYRDGTHLNAKCSKICSQIVDVVNKDTVLSRIRDSENKFSHAGTLTQIKFNEVINFVKTSFERTTSKTDFEVRELVDSMVNKTPIAESIISKFGL